VHVVSVRKVFLVSGRYSDGELPNTDVTDLRQFGMAIEMLDQKVTPNEKEKP
jgi:hypothetical protein